IPARGAIRRAGRSSTEVVIHVDENVAALRERDDLVALSAIASVAQGSIGSVEAKGEALEVRLDVCCAANGDFPTVSLDDVACVNLANARHRTLSRRLAASGDEL